MQMRVGLQIRLSKQTEIKIRKKEKKTVVSARKKKKCRFWTQSKRETLLENLKRKAEGEHSPQRLPTQICYDVVQKSFLVHFHLFWNPAGDYRLHQNRNNMTNDGQSSRGEACHNPITLSPIIHVHVVPVSEIMITSDIFTFCEHRKCLKWQLGYRKTSFPSLALSCLQSFHVLSGELAFSQSHNHRDTDWRAD